MQVKIYMQERFHIGDYMNWMSAKNFIEDILKNKFKYLYMRKNLNISTIHLTFKMDSKSHNLQMSLRFEKKWCDILCFISPTVLTEDSKAYWQVLQTVNFLNWYIKSWGRFYIDDYNDLAYSLRLDYNVLEIMPDECAKEIEAAVDYYADLFNSFLKLCEGEESYNNIKDLIKNMWN